MGGVRLSGDSAVQGAHKLRVVEAPEAGSPWHSVSLDWEFALMSGHVEPAAWQSTLASQQFQVMRQPLLDLQVAQHG